MRILLIEDNKPLCQNITRQLKKEGYDIDYCYDGLDGLEYLKYQAYDLVLLDRMLPSIDGISLLKKMRNQGYHIPVIIITALGDIDDKIIGLDAGADDYITKPFVMKELHARIRALRRRPVQWESLDFLQHGDLSFNQTTQILTGPSDTLSLSKRESRLIELFLQNPNRLLPRELIFSRVWGPDTLVDNSNLDNYIRFLRRRLNNVGSIQKIKTVRSVGYVLEDPNAQ